MIIIGNNDDDVIILRCDLTENNLRQARLGF